MNIFTSGIILLGSLILCNFGMTCISWCYANQFVSEVRAIKKWTWIIGGIAYLMALCIYGFYTCVLLG